jgi:hypothetical protein
LGTDQTKMTLDIRGSIKNTKLSSNRYVVLEELISNAIDSFLIRQHEDASAPSMRVEIEVDFSAADLLEDREVMAVSCKDNGCGLGDDQLKAFLTKDTSYKDDLPIPGIGKCKGALPSASLWVGLWVAIGEMGKTRHLSDT